MFTKTFCENLREIPSEEVKYLVQLLNFPPWALLQLKTYMKIFVKCNTKS